MTAAPGGIGLGRGRVTAFHAVEPWLAGSPAPASVATLLAKWGQRVLLVDWDFSGQGLEQFFSAGTVVGERTGLVDMAEARWSGTELDWRACVVEAAVSEQGPPVRLITAGRRDGRHAQRLRRLDWRALFTEADFGAYLEQLRTEWRREHDFVLVNSPAGLSDVATICTVYLPDVLVALFGANDAGVEGVADIAGRARRARSRLPFDRGHLVVLPVPAWDVRSSAYPRSRRGLRTIGAHLGELYRDVLPREVELEEGLEALRVPERPAPGEPAPGEAETAIVLDRVLDSYQVLARMVGSGLRWADSVRPGGGPSGSSEKADFFISYSDADRQWATWVAWVLEQVGYRVLMWAWDVVPSPQAVQRLARGVRRAKRTIALLSPAYLGSIYHRAEWQAALASDPRWPERELLPVMVAPCQVDGVLASIAAVDLVATDETTAARRLLAGASQVLEEREGARHEPSTQAVSAGRPTFPRHMEVSSYESLDSDEYQVHGAAARPRAVAGITAWVSARARAAPGHLRRLTPAAILAWLAAAALTAMAAEEGEDMRALARLGPEGFRLGGVLADVAAHLRETRGALVTREDLSHALAHALLDRLGGEREEVLRRDLAALLRSVGAAEAALRAAFDSESQALRERLAEAFIDLSATHQEFARLREDAFSALNTLQRELTESVFSGDHQAQRSRPALREVTVLRRQLLAATDVGQLRREGPEESPYRGLTPFQVEDVRWFHGRAALTAALVNRLAERLAGPSSMVMLLGASGAGKSSLLNAGLVPGIASGMLAMPGSETWPQMLMHPGPSPVRALAAGIGELADVDAGIVEDQVRTNPEAFAATVWQAAGGRGDRRVLVVVDQFEELFTQCPDRTERDTFIQALRATTSPLPPAETAPAAIVLGLRADRYADCTGHPDLMAMLEGGQVVVGPMTADELRDAIEKPAATAGLTLEPGLVDVILRDLDPHLTAGRQGSYDPGRLPLLSHALLATWQRRRERRLDLAGYQEAGGIDGAITNTADRLYDDLGPAERGVMRRVLLQMVSVSESAPDDARARVRREELLALGAEDERAAVENLLDRLVETRLVTASEEHYEITHEALLRAWPRLRAWIDEDRDWLPLRRHLSDAATAWERSSQDPAELYGPVRLSEVHEKIGGSWRAALGPLEAAFLAASEQQVARRQGAERRRVQGRRAVAVLLIALLVLMGLLAALALQQRATADAQRNLADAREVVAEAGTLRETDPGLAAQLSVQAYRLDQTAETRSGVLGTRDPEYRELPAGGAVSAMADSPAGGRLAVAGQSGRIELWDLSSGARVVLGDAHEGAVYAVAFGPDGTTLAGATASGDVSLWNVASGQRTGILTGHGRPVNSVAFSPDGHLIATGGSDGTVELWDARSLAPLAVLVRAVGVTAPVYELAFSPDGRTVASAMGDATIVLWDVVRGVPSAILSGSGGPVRLVTFSPDGQTMASADDDGTVSLWDIARQTIAATIPETTIGRIRAVAFDSDGRTLAVGSDGGSVQLWRVVSRLVAPLTSLHGSLASILALAFEPDGTLAAAEGNSRIGLWDLGGSSILTGASATGRRPSAAVTFGPPHSGLVATAGADGAIRLWRTGDGSLSWTVPVVQSRTALNGSPSPVLAMARDPAGRTLLAAPTAGPGVVVWDVTTHRQVAVLGVPGDEPPVTALAFSPDGRFVAAGSSGLVRLWSVQAPERPVSSIYNALGAINALAFALDGRVLASASDDGTIVLSDVGTGARLAQLLVQLGQVQAMAITPDGATVAGAGTDGTVTLWNARSHQQLGAPFVIEGGTGVGVVSVAFSPDGRTMATVAQDGTVRLWSLPDRGLLATLGGLTDVTGVAFAPDGSTIVGSGPGGALISWDTDPERVGRWVCAADPALTPDQWRQDMPADQAYRSGC